MEERKRERKKEKERTKRQKEQREKERKQEKVTDLQDLASRFKLTSQSPGSVPIEVSFFGGFRF